MSQAPTKVEKVNLTDRDGHNILGKDYQPIKTREYTFNRYGKDDVVIQDHWPGHTYGPEGTPGNQGHILIFDLSTILVMAKFQVPSNITLFRKNHD
ncbi:hypothetical protein D8B20_02805 [Candidatus Pantoea soli]|uniref:HNH/Endo VII superfamily nuclease toxins domain-containing protein n=1 Tax=Candidatus Pantoea soli TaxID=3098669 RepID=A0A518XHE6_9GAMM|nr:hypothetical protein D8B20_02805 [Pantoea soli]